MAESLLPTQFVDLEPFAGAWALATQLDRERKRAASAPADLKTLYEVLLPRVEPILEYLDQFPLDSLPEDARRLLYLTLSFAEVAPFVECYGGEPHVPNSFDEARFIAVHGDRIG